MSKSWFRFSMQEELAPNNGTSHHEPVVPQAAENPEPPPRPAKPEPIMPGGYQSFDQIYSNSAVKPPRLPYGILKIAAMVNSAHLDGMSPEAKRCSLLMALEAAEVEI